MENEKYIYFQLETGFILNYVDFINYSYSEEFPIDQLFPITDEEWALYYPNNMDWIISPPNIEEGEVIAYVEPPFIVPDPPE